MPRDLGCSSSLSWASGEQRSTLGPAQARREERVVSGSQRSLMGARLTTHAEAVAGCPRPSTLPYQMGGEDRDFAFTWTTRFYELGMKRLRVPYRTLYFACPCGAQFKEAVITLDNLLPFPLISTLHSSVPSAGKLFRMNILTTFVVSLRYLPFRSSNQGCASSAGHVILDLPLRRPCCQPAKCIRYCRNLSRQFNVHSRVHITQVQYASSTSLSSAFSSVSHEAHMLSHGPIYLL